MTRTFVYIINKQPMKTTAIVEMWDDKTISIYVPEFDGFSLSVIQL